MRFLDRFEPFATSPENSFSLIVGTLLFNALSFQSGLDLMYLVLPYAEVVAYILILYVYAFCKAPSMSQDKQTGLNRHLFHTSLWGGLALIVLWQNFLYPHIYLDEVLAAHLPNVLLIKQYTSYMRFLPFALFFCSASLTEFKVSLKEELTFLSRCLRSPAFFVGMFFTLPYIYSQIQLLASLLILPSALSFVTYPIALVVFGVFLPKLIQERVSQV